MYIKQRGLLFILALHTVGVSLSMQQQPWPCKNYYKALKDASVKTIADWLKQGWDMKQKDETGYSVLWRVLNRPDMITFLIEQGADIHERDHMGKTFLHEAAWQGCPEVVELLIANGIEVNVLTSNGTTPLLDACERTHAKEEGDTRFKIAQQLLAHGADVNKRPNYGYSALHKLAYSGLTKVAGLLLAHGADVSYVHTSQDSRWPSAGSMLRRALQEGNNDIAHLYIQYSFAHNNVDLKEMREDVSCGFMDRNRKFFSGNDVSACSLHMLKEGMKSLMNGTDCKLHATCFLGDMLTKFCLMREHCEDSVFDKDYLPLDMFKLILQEVKDQSSLTEVLLRPSRKRIQEIITFFKDEGFDQSDPDFMQQLEEYKNKQ
ncbi:MAG: ankyrin repeat domain-containing protein [Candidatus Babeliales bacterium]